MTLTLTPTQLITGEELLAMGDIGPSELIDGRIVSMSPTGGEHSYVEFTLGGELRNYVQAHKLGWVLGGEVGIYIRRNPDRIRAADVAFLSKARSPKRPSAGYLTVAPELVVEILSLDDRWQDVRQKIKDYFSAGVERVWVVDPAQREILVYRSPNEAQTFDENATVLGEGLLAGFALPVISLFAEE